MLTSEQFRRLALALPDAAEGEHMNHPDFRAGGRIFATILPDAKAGMVKVTPVQQRELLQRHPGQFETIAGAWGRSGCTKVVFAAADLATVRDALTAAWENVMQAPPRRGAPRKKAQAAKARVTNARVRKRR
jgi:hypothetical protein